MIEQNKALVERFVSALNAHRLDLLDELLTPNFSGIAKPYRASRSGTWTSSRTSSGRMRPRFQIRTRR